MSGAESSAAAKELSVVKDMQQGMSEAGRKAAESGHEFEEHDSTGVAIDTSLGGTDSSRLAKLNVKMAAASGAVAGISEQTGATKTVAHEGSDATSTIAETAEHEGEVSRTGGAFGAAVTAISLRNGVVELEKAVHEGRTADAVLGTANVGVGVTNLVMSGAQVLGKEAPVALETGVRAAGAVVLVATAAVNVYNAKPEDRAAVASGEVVKAGVGIGAAAVGEGIATAAGLSGVAAAAVPVVAAGATVYAVDQGVEKVMDDRKVYKNWEQGLEEQKKPEKDSPAPADRAPDPGDYKNLMAAMRQSSDNIRYDQTQSPAAPKGLIKVNLDSVLNPGAAQKEGIERLNRDISKSQTGMQRSDKSLAFMGKVDLRNPKNLQEMGHAIDVEVAKQKKIMAENESAVPAYLRTSNGALKDFSATGGRAAQEYMEARQKLATLEGGKAELAMYQKDLKAYKEKAAAEKAAPARPDAPSAKDSFQKATGSPTASDAKPDVAATQEKAPTPTADLTQRSADLQSNTPSARDSFQKAAGGPGTSETKPIIAATRENTAVMTEQPAAPPEKLISAAEQPRQKVGDEQPDEARETASSPSGDSRVRDNRTQQPAAAIPTGYDVVADGGVKTDVRASEAFNGAANTRAPAPAPEVAATNNTAYTNTRQQTVSAPAP